MAAHPCTNVIDLKPFLARRARNAHVIRIDRAETSAVIPLPLGRASRNLVPPLPPAA